MLVNVKKIPLTIDQLRHLMRFYDDEWINYFEGKYLDTGLYQSIGSLPQRLGEHLSFEAEFPALGEILFSANNHSVGSIASYGVCDSPDQFKRTEIYKFISESQNRFFFVDFFCTDSKDHNKSGGYYGELTQEEEKDMEPWEKHSVFPHPTSYEYLYNFEVIELTKYPHLYFPDSNYG